DRLGQSVRLEARDNQLVGVAWRTAGCPVHAGDVRSISFTESDVGARENQVARGRAVRRPWQAPEPRYEVEVLGCPGSRGTAVANAQTQPSQALAKCDDDRRLAGS